MPPAIVTVPVTFVWSYCVPTVVPSISTRNTPARLRSPVLVMPGLRPGASVPPAFTVTEPPIVPVPPSVLPAFTTTGPGMDPLTRSVPPETVFVPVLVLAPDSVSVPAPTLTRPPFEPMAPPNVVLVPSPPTVTVLGLMLSAPPPWSEPNVLS